MPFVNVFEYHHHRRRQQHQAMAPAYEVTEALKIAREDPESSKDPTVSSILNTALAGIWAKIQAQPNAYVMTRGEFAVFNYFQHLFRDDKTATEARRRYWNNARGG